MRNCKINRGQEQGLTILVTSQEQEFAEGLEPRTWNPTGLIGSRSRDLQIHLEPGVGTGRLAQNDEQKIAKSVEVKSSKSGKNVGLEPLELSRFCSRLEGRQFFRYL